MRLPRAIRDKYEIREWKHASAILQADFREEWDEIIDVLANIEVLRSHVLAGGGGRSKITQGIDGAFYGRGWEEKKWETKIVVDEATTETPTHKVDCYKNRVAVEIEWSNKDPFFDRDLNNFRLLFDLRAISVGVIITKSDELKDVFKGLGKKVWISSARPPRGCRNWSRASKVVAEVGARFWYSALRQRPMLRIDNHESR